MFDRIAIALAGVMFSGILLFAFWPHQPVNSPESWCKQYPNACAVEQPDSKLNQALRQQASCTGLTGPEWFACHDEYWRLYQEFRQGAS